MEEERRSKGFILIVLHSPEKAYHREVSYFKVADSNFRCVTLEAQKGQRQVSAGLKHPGVRSFTPSSQGS